MCARGPRTSIILVAYSRSGYLDLRIASIGYLGIVHRASGTVFLFLPLEAMTLSLDSERLGNTRRRVCLFYRWAV